MSEDTQIDVEAEALEMGWTPLDKFRGNPDKWVDAETFVERGHTVMPILRKNNERLRHEVAQASAEARQAKEATARMMQEHQETMEAYKEMTDQRAKATIETLKKELIQAKRDGDYESEVQIQETLDDLKTDAKQRATPLPRNSQGFDDPGAKIEDSPEFRAWVEDNPWFTENPEMNNYATGQGFFILSEARAKRQPMGMRQFLDKVTEMVKERYPDRSTQPDKVGGARGGSRQSSGSRTYADLTQEEKDACAHFESKLVGPGKMFKTVSDYRAHYAKELDA